MSEISIDDLSTVERKILLICGRMCISVKKNVNEETLKKKLPDKYSSEFNFALKSLLHKGILVKYRPHNYGVSKEGRILAYKLKELEDNDLYSDLRLLLLLK